MSKAGRCLLVGMHMPNHASHSGYDKLAHYVDCAYLDAGRLPFNGWHWGRDSTLKRRVSFATLELAASYQERQYALVHAIYADIHVTWSLAPRPGKVTVATVHLPVRDLRDQTTRVKRMRFNRLAAASGIIALSRAEAKVAQEIFPRARCCFIPHGVESDLYDSSLTAIEAESFEIAMVGTNFRDMKILREVIVFGNANRRRWHFQLFGMAGPEREAFQSFPNVTVHARLDTSTYLRKLQLADVLFLPLTFATANNALLEAHTLGTPVVASDVPGARDYAVSTTSLFRSVSEAIDALDNLSGRSAEELEVMRRKTRAESARFDWARVASRVEKFYAELLEHQPCS